MGLAEGTSSSFGGLLYRQDDSAPATASRKAIPAAPCARCKPA